MSPISLSDCQNPTKLEVRLLSKAQKNGGKKFLYNFKIASSNLVLEKSSSYRFPLKMAVFIGSVNVLERVIFIRRSNIKVYQDKLPMFVRKGQIDM